MVVLITFFLQKYFTKFYLVVESSSNTTTVNLSHKLCIGKSTGVSVRCICGSSLVVETWWVHKRIKVRLLYHLTATKLEHL